MKRPVNLKALIRVYDVKRVNRYTGEVIKIGPPGSDDNKATICFTGRKGAHDFARDFPRERLAITGGDFPGAKIEYTIYVSGSVTISNLRRVGPTRGEFISSDPHLLTRKELAELDEP